MRPLLQLARVRSTRRSPLVGPAWIRRVAQLCLLLITVSACVQASHVHDDAGLALWKSSQGKTPAHPPANTPANTTDHCLLCVVMHAAMPSAHGVAPVPVQHTQASIPAAPIARRREQVSFDLFSRPPPAVPAPAPEAGTAAGPRAL